MIVWGWELNILNTHNMIERGENDPKSSTASSGEANVSADQTVGKDGETFIDILWGMNP